MGLLSSIFNSVFKLFSKLWNFFKKWMPYILIAIAVCFIAFPAFAFVIPAFSVYGVGLATATTVSGYLGAALALGGAFMLAPGETAAAFDSVAGGIADAASGVIDAGGRVATDILSTVVDVVTSSPLLWVAGGLMLFFLLPGRKEKKQAASTIAGGKRQNDDDQVPASLEGA